MIDLKHLNIYVPESVGDICAATSGTTIASNAAKLIAAKLGELPEHYLAQADRHPDTPKLNLRMMLHNAVYAQLDRLSRAVDLSIAETCAALICGMIDCRSPDTPVPDREEDIKLPIGCLKFRRINNNSYWYWRYYKRDGHRADIFIHKCRGAAIAKVKAMGIPDDANPKYKNRV